MAVRKTRDRLAEQGISDPDFDAELLAINARTVMSGTPAIVLLIALIAFGAAASGLGANMLLWALLATTATIAKAFLSRRYLAQKPEKRDPKRWTPWFVGSHALLAVCWAWFAFVPCVACDGVDMLFFKSLGLLVAMAATVTISHNLRWSVFAEFGLPVVVFAAINDGMFDPRGIAASAGLLAALLFFSFIAVRLHRASLSSLSFRSENNALIAELEMARSISEEARRRAEEANLAKSRFLASMSHELRTPLNAILGFSEVMAKEVLGPMNNENYKSYANDINLSGQHLLKLINEILDLSR
ncbi:MAG: histidine kinase dimerization/phospho-acceptor domain-containing protein, partial [Oricola sp.]